MSGNQTEHLQILKPNPSKFVSEGVEELRTGLDQIDFILNQLSRALNNTATKDHGHGIDGIQGLRSALEAMISKTEGISFSDLSDVIGVENARAGYILTRAAEGFVFQSLISILGENKLPISGITNLADELAKRVKVAGQKDLGGFQSTGQPLGSFLGRSIELSTTDSNFQYGENNGDFTLVAPPDGYYIMSIKITNVAGAGAATLVGFLEPQGSFSSDIGSEYRLIIDVSGTSKVPIFLKVK